MIEIRRHQDAREFLQRAEAWLAEDEIANAAILASARHARADDSHYEKPVYWATVEVAGRIVGCAYRTPPYLVGVTALPLEATAPLVASLEEAYGKIVSGFSGIEPTVSAVAAAWCERHGGIASVSQPSRQRLLILPDEIPPSPAAGALRAAVPSDAAIAQAWGAASAMETGVAALDGVFCARLIGARQLYFWDEGAQRCMVGVLRQTDRSAAIGIVYTPPAYRDRGYASAAVGALCLQLRERGIGRCYLYIHPANDGAVALAKKLASIPVHDALNIVLS